MNYFAHALPFLDDPCFAAGTAIPDWLSVSDRQCRVRSRHLQQTVEDPDAATAALARGMRQHLLDDARFHETRAFAEISLSLTVAARDVLADDPGFRPSFLGHLLVELLLDAALIAENPTRLDQYYRLLETVDADWVQSVVNRIAPRPATRLAWFISLFRRERVLADYLDDDRLMMRLNQIMRRIGLSPLPDTFRGILPHARCLVTARKGELIDDIPVDRRLVA